MDDFDRVAAITSRQQGVVSRRQLLGAGVSSSSIARAVESSHLATAHRGVYRLAALPPTFESRLWAAQLWVGPEGALSHLAAGWMWRFDGLGFRPPEQIDVLIPFHRHFVQPPGLTLHRSRTFGPRDVFTLKGLRCTGVARTLVDLATLLEPLALAKALDSAARRNRGAYDWVIATIERLGCIGRRGSRTLYQLASRHTLGPTGSGLETSVREWLHQKGLPVPMPQLQICDDDGDQLGVFDFAWPERNLVLLVHGRQWHLSASAFEKDHAQSNALQAAGWRVLVVTSYKLRHESELLLHQLRTALLGRRG